MSDAPIKLVMIVTLNHTDVTRASLQQMVLQKELAELLKAEASKIEWEIRYGV